MSSPNLFSTKSDAAYAEVRRRILAGELAPGRSWTSICCPTRWA